MLLETSILKIVHFDISLFEIRLTCGVCSVVHIDIYV